VITLGIMSLSIDSENNYITEVAKRAETCGIECFRFLPSKINPVTHSVLGKKYDSAAGTWKDEEAPLPKLLYDRCFYGDDEHSKQCIPIVSWLKNRNDITFLGYGLPNKLDLYEALKDSILSPYLPYTQRAEDEETVLSELAKHKKLILKPINGSQGYGIYYLKESQKNYHVKTEKQKKIISRIFPNERKLVQWLRPLIRQRAYLVQPYLELSNGDLQPFDIRILLQKNEQGKWTERGKGIRTGLTGGILSNLSAGGAVSNFETWVSALPAPTREYVSNELRYIIKNLTELLEKTFLPLFEVGLDIGFAKNGSLWILDMNSKPGRKVILSTQPDLLETLYRAPLLYAKFISHSGQNERKRFYAKTLSH
jgi:glutathione synthase/RimK-type ligase-like ATP-grasp enzyme